MTRRIGMYFAWDRPAETGPSFGDLNNRFPALYELRRLFWPRYEALAGAPGGQDIEGYLQAIFFHNFARFEERVATLTAATHRAARATHRQRWDAVSRRDAGRV